MDLEIRLDMIQKESDRLNSVVSKKQEEHLQAQCRFDGKALEVQESNKALKSLPLLRRSPFRPTIRIKTWLDRSSLNNWTMRILVSNKTVQGRSVDGDELPTGSVKRSRQQFDLSDRPSVHQTLAASHHFDHGQIEQFMQVAQMEAATKAAASQPCG